MTVWPAVLLFSNLDGNMYFQRPQRTPRFSHFYANRDVLQTYTIPRQVFRVVVVRPLHVTLYLLLLQTKDWSCLNYH